MAADVKNQASVFRKNIGDYPQCCELEAATIASRQNVRRQRATAQ